MADKQYGWLDRETAERLLRGESLDNAVDPADRDDAERLAKTLGTLSVDPPMSSAELPGEAAALAAFRTAHANRATAAATPGHATSADAGLIRIGAPGHRTPRPRHRRTVRVGLAAVVAFGMVGGVVVAAATGMLPTPFGDDEPRPGASVSAAVTPDRPLVSPTPDGAAKDEPTPDGSVGASPDRAAPRTDAGGAPSADPDGHGRKGGFGSSWDGARSACRDIRDGRRLSTDRRRALEGLAGGSTRVWKYCNDVLKTSDGQAHREDDRKGSDKDQDGPGGDDDSHHGVSGGNGDGDGNGHGDGNDHHQNGGLVTPSSSPSDDATLQPKRAAAVPEPSPNPSYSAL